MSFMGKLARMDSALQRSLDNGFALVFGGRVVPAEIEELLKQEAEDGLKTVGRATLQAPNYYRVGVSLKDYASLTEEFPELPHSFADQMTRFIRNSGWSTDGPIVVTIEGLEYLHTGQLHSASYVNSDPKTESTYKKHQKQHKVVGAKKTASSKEKKATPQKHSKQAHKATRKSASHSSHSGEGTNGRDPRMNAENKGSEGIWHSQPNPEGVAARHGQSTEASSHQPSVTLALQDGSSCIYTLRMGSNTIGRSGDVDVRLADTGVSRQHAEIVWDGHDAVLVDLQSTNGTVVNGTPIENWLLADGDVISIGHTSMSVHFSE